MDEIWISIFDGRECDSCHELHQRKESSQYWDSTGRPRARPTICVIYGHVCRCELFPDEEDGALADLIKERDRLLDEAIEGMFKGIKIDIGKGGRAINLKEFEQIEGLLTLPFSKIEYYENLIWEWKLLYPKVRTLPDEFYEMANIKRQTAWLERELKI